MARKLDSSFLSFPPPPSSRTEFFNRLIRPTGPLASPRHPSVRHRPSPLDLYELPTLEALPTPPSSSSITSHSSIEQTLDRQKSKTVPSGDGKHRAMRSFAKKHKEKEMERDNQSSFLPFDDQPEGRRPSTPNPRNVRTTGMSRPRRPAPLDPSIFGNRVHVVRAEDPIDMVLRLEKEERERAKTSSFSPFSDISGPVHPLPLDPSIFGHQVKVVRAEDPIDMVLRLEGEDHKRAMKQSFTPFGDEKQRARAQSQSGPPKRVSESRNGSVKQRHDAPMPSILGVIEGGHVRETMRLPIQHPPPSGSERLQRIPSRASGRPPSSASSSPRHLSFPRPESPLITSRDYAPKFTNRISSTMVDESPTLGSIHLPSVNRHISLTPSNPSISEYSRSPYLENPDDEQLTALEILEELNGGVEDGWEFGILAKQRAQAGMDQRSSRRDGRTSPDQHRSSIKEVANSVRSWRESRKKKDNSERGPKAGSIKPKHSVDGLEPLYEVTFTVERAKIPPPIPPRAPGRSLPPLKVQIERMLSGSSSVEIPIVLDSPVKCKEVTASSERIRRDIPESVMLSPPTSPIPIQQQPLPPIPSLSPLSKPLSRLLQTRSKRPSTSESLAPRPFTPVHSTFSPLNSPSSHPPRPRLSARDEPHAQLSPRPVYASLSADRVRQGMTALSFLALDDPNTSWNDRSLEGLRRESVQTHIIPPQELVKLVGRRRTSSDSEWSSGEVEAGENQGRMSLGLSPPSKHHRRSLESPLRTEGTSLSPPPRSRPSYPAQPSNSSSNRPYLHINPSLSFHNASPSPSQAFASHSTPSPRKSYNEHPFLAYSPPPSDLGHASELSNGVYSPRTPEKEVEKQALSEWLSQPRVRKGSAPASGTVRKRDMGMVG